MALARCEVRAALPDRPHSCPSHRQQLCGAMCTIAICSLHCRSLQHNPFNTIMLYIRELRWFRYVSLPIHMPFPCFRVLRFSFLRFFSRPSIQIAFLYVLKFYCVVVNFLLACRHVKNVVPELLTTVYGAKELDDCDRLLTVCWPS